MEMKLLATFSKMKTESCWQGRLTLILIEHWTLISLCFRKYRIKCISCLVFPPCCLRPAVKCLSVYLFISSFQLIGGRRPPAIRKRIFSKEYRGEISEIIVLLSSCLQVFHSYFVSCSPCSTFKEKKASGLIIIYES